ncbi:MAG: type II toxin-antitoxin system HicA family toxin [Gemmatimonadaceae bacterium]
MGKRHRRTLDAIFENPVRSDIRWSAVESLVKALGGQVTEREGSRVAFVLNGMTAVFHRPHPKPVAKKWTIRDVRDFLERAGVK